MQNADDFIPPGRTLPHSVEAEMAVLGAILINNKVFERVSYLSPDHFALLPHRAIYEAIAASIARGRLADPITVKNQLNGHLTDVGGIEYLAKLVDAAVVPANAVQYGALVRDLAMRRALIEACDEAISIAYSGDVDADPSVLLSGLQERIGGLVSASDNGAVWASEVEMEDIEWLWPGYIPIGMYTLVAGAGSTGKSSMMYDWAATTTSAGKWPDGSACEKGRVALLETEDPMKQVILPRLAAAGAVLSDVALFDEPSKLPLNSESLSSWLLHERIKMLVISPITRLMPDDGSTNSESDVRRSLLRVQDACAKAKCAFIGLGHINKNDAARAVFRVLGSVAYVNASRAVYLVTSDKASGIRTITATEKFNIAEQPGGWNYDIEHVGPMVASTRLKWLGPSNASADELLAQAAETGTSKSAVSDAVEYLRTRLKDGPLDSDQLIKDAKACGHSFASVKRARKDAGIISEKIASKWFMKLRGVSV